MALYICSNCGYGAASWMGRCPDCDSWNTFEEKETKKRDSKTKKLEATKLSTIKTVDKRRSQTSLEEFDRVLGGGIVEGEVILLTGEPGVGKSTLLLQALKNLRILYISGEESAEQVQERAGRLKADLDNILYANELQVEAIVEAVSERLNEIDVVVIDSVQTLYSQEYNTPAGTVNQIKTVTSKLTKMAKRLNVPVLIVGHITKAGVVSGPKTLEHLVDCVLAFEGEKMSHHRILRAIKNRFGNTEEIGIFEMKRSGLSQVNDPLAFLEDIKGQAIGKTIVGVSEGKRILFFEIQTLASYSSLAYPRRVVKGIDYNKLLLILAVLKKQVGLPIDRYDVYVNVVSGVSIRSTAADLGIAAALISSLKNLSIPKKTVFVGEVGLLGEVRRVVAEEQIIREAKRLKFSNILSSQNVQKIKDLRSILF